jgi:acylphosphatase
MKKIKITLSGRVQGVCFRYFAYEIALQYHIKGYVKNLWNGDVEIAAIGLEENVEKFLKKVKKGPPSARIYNTEIEELPDSINYDSFKITY